MALDRRKLSRLLALTASSEDGEALAALRMAQSLLDRAGITWNQILRLTDDGMALAAAPEPKQPSLPPIEVMLLDLARRRSLSQAGHIVVAGARVRLARGELLDRRTLDTIAVMWRKRPMHTTKGGGAAHG